MSREFVLVHGMSHDAWAWEPLARRLEASGHAMDVPRTYVRCLRDAAVTPVMAARYAARLGVTPIDIDCAHSPVLSALDDLVRVLEKIP
jgi:hypothetical protein